MKKIILSAVILICCAIIGACIYSNDKTAESFSSGQSAAGVIVRDRSSSPYSSDFYLCGEWEYYPDILLYSRDDQTFIPDAAGSIDPAVILDNQFRQKSPSSAMPYHYIRTESPGEPVPVTVPCRDPRNLYRHGFQETSSYRMVIQDLPAVEDGNMTFSLPGTVFGNFEVFINGVRCVPMVIPYSYPSFYFPVPESGEIEIVIQTGKTTSFLNIAPRITFKGLSMVDFDSYRSTLLRIGYSLITAFIIMMILMFSLERKYLFLPFWIGIVFSLNYVLNNIWGSGQLSFVTRFLPLYLIPQAAWFLFAGGIVLGCLFLRSSLTGKRTTGALPALSLIPAAALLVRICGMYLLDTSWLLLLSDILTLLSLAGLLVILFINTKEMAVSTFLVMTGLILMIAGSCVSFIHNCYGFWNVFMYFQPFTILVYTVIVFVNNKVTQKLILWRTRELLALEKENVKMQTAMLASQIKPHFLYNTLTTIQELCYVDAGAAAKLIVRFSNYLRTNIDFMNYDDLIPFPEELEHIRNYMYIQNARYQGAILYKEEIAFDDFLIPPLSIQPFVENAVKHGIMKNEKTGTVILRVFRDSRYIYVHIINDGEKFTRDSMKSGHSIENIEKRLKSLRKAEVSINFDSEEPETIVEIRIPIDTIMVEQNEIFNN